MAAQQAPLALGFSRQEHWSGLPFPSPMHESEKWKWSRSVMFDSVRPHRWQPNRLRWPWDSPGKNTGVGCHFLLQCMKVKSKREVAQSCLTLSDPTDCSLPGSSAHAIFQARVREWGAIAFSTFSRGYSQPKDWTQVSCIAGRFFTVWNSREAPFIWYIHTYTNISESLCCIPETNRILLINYNSINHTTC